MVWYNLSQLKDGDELEFQPKSVEGKEKFSIWDNKNKTYIKEGSMLDTEKGMQQVNKYIKLSDDEKKFFGRKPAFTRRVLIKGEDTWINIAVMAEKALRDQMATVSTLGKEPLAFTYILKKMGAGLLTRYAIRIGKEAGMPDDVKLDKVVVSKLDLTEMEKTYLKALQDYVTYPKAKDYTNEERVSVFVQKLGLTEDRARRIVSENFE